ncbi:hypothetical protein BX666DRAFT_1937527 [Dichotomocladium elegans]|nr:hypothetical protein BX666DRAFT_1937527 [Dichotomocladium elegans]
MQARTEDGFSSPETLGHADEKRKSILPHAVLSGAIFCIYFFSMSLIPFLILIVAAPLLVYTIGHLLPQSHIVSRSRVFDVSRTELWNLLCDVEAFPAWRRRLNRIIIRERLEDRLVYEEHSPRRKIVVVQVKQLPFRKLLRILQEIPTFSGSWTFELDEELVADIKKSRRTHLKITQQGVIKRPILRVLHMLVFGFHRRIDQFLDDLDKKVASGRYT